eukprot:TRINITY_DN18382_c0_g1_i2.p1 TRINITY_DN18382_c0_g1~~TRINITY_DN18382_c0_g1_i2.p1  ORF type:complete len:361 (-),score=21.18 TRINITY_DN18382_c0_g1_i2:93-1175(-)
MIELCQPLEEEIVDLNTLKARTRWDGILSKEQLMLCRENGIDVAYDCCQQGWIVYDEFEEFGEANAVVLGTYENSSSIKQLDMLVEEFNSELTRVNASASHVDTGFLAINNLLNRSNYETDLRLHDEHHCVLLCKMAETLSLSLPEQTDISVGYRNWEESDVDTYMRIMGNEKVWQYLPEEYPHPFTKELAKNLIEVANIGDSSTTRAIVFEGEVIGQARLLVNNSYSELKAAEVVYMLDENYWGRGLMSKILLDFVNTSFADHDLDFIYAWIKPENKASVKCAERAGFIKDHFSREQDLAQTSQRPGFARYVCFGASKSQKKNKQSIKSDADGIGRFPALNLSNAVQAGKRKKRKTKKN